MRSAASQGDAFRCHGVDVLAVDAGNVGERTVSFRRQIKRPYDERRHLGTRDLIVRTERGPAAVATDCDSSSFDGGDVARVRILRIHITKGVRQRSQPEGSGEERRHLGAGHVGVGAKGRTARNATRRNPLSRDRLDVALMRRIVVVEELTAGELRFLG